MEPTFLQNCVQKNIYIVNDLGFILCRVARLSGRKQDKNGMHSVSEVAAWRRRLNIRTITSTLAARSSVYNSFTIYPVWGKYLVERRYHWHDLLRFVRRTTRKSSEGILTKKVR